uniref:Scv136-like protein n=1 Tax=Pasiphaea japonica whispovirus TaxID=2984286 RepID=A0A9C7BP51_9VIRU|nr:MAG: scv136-like protein [Pasiphaea japonica whispovirus]
MESTSKRPLSSPPNSCSADISKGKKMNFGFIGPKPKTVSMENMDTNCTKYTVDFLNNYDKTVIQYKLEKYGFCIVENCLNLKQCQEIINGTWTAMETMTSKIDVPVDRRNIKTWGSIKKCANFRNIYTDNGIAHAEFMWRVRENPKIMKVYADLHGCKEEDLLVSFDGISFQIPPEHPEGRNGWYKHCWYHVDNSFNQQNDRPICYQGQIVARDVNPGDYTIGFLRGSHKSFDEFGQKFGIKKKVDNFKMQNDEQMKFIEDRHKPIRVTCKAGSLVLFNNKLFHCGLEPLKNRQKMNIRNVVFVCYAHRQDATDNIIKRRRKYFRESTSTTHWPAKGLRANTSSNKNKLHPINSQCINITPKIENLIG